MKTVVIATMLSIGGVAGAMQRPALRDAETPRATDLLRAERLEEQVQKRLRPPAPRGPAWRHGGSGWDDQTAAPADAPGSVIIHLNRTRQRTPRP